VVGSGSTLQFFSAAVGGDDGGAPLETVERAHDGDILHMAWDVESRYCLTAGGDRVAKVWVNRPGLREKVKVLEQKLTAPDVNASFAERLRAEIKAAKELLAVAK